MTSVNELCEHLERGAAAIADSPPQRSEYQAGIVAGQTKALRNVAKWLAGELPRDCHQETRIVTLAQTLRHRAHHARRAAGNHDAQTRYHAEHMARAAAYEAVAEEVMGLLFAEEDAPTPAQELAQMH